MTEYRRARASETGKQNSAHLTTSATAKGLRIRESTKYALIGEWLDKMGIAHIFEYPIGKFIFDLALVDACVLIEFDGPYHSQSKTQIGIDDQKTRVAYENGWQAHRVKTASGDEALDPQLVEALVLSLYGGHGEEAG